MQGWIDTIRAKAPSNIIIVPNETSVPYTPSSSWGTTFQTTINGDGASWIAWVADNAWTPNMFSDTALTQLTEFGTLTKNWLASKAASDWVQ